jgi:aldehyde dehydrogenase (NAD+)
MKFQNFIGGEWVPAKSGKTFLNRNPADLDEVIGEFPASDAKDVDAAVAAAKKAFDGWRRTPAPRRGELIFRVGEILLKKKESLAHAMTREMGKVLKETRGDVQEGIDTAYVHAGEGRRIHGFTAPSELPNKASWAVRSPNPESCPITRDLDGDPDVEVFRRLSRGTRSSSPRATRPRAPAPLRRRGGSPPVVNLVHGAAVGQAARQSPGCRVVNFTGSRGGVGREIGQSGSGPGRVSLERGRGRS